MGTETSGLNLFPRDWKVSEVGELETCLPSSYEELVRARLSEVSERAKTLWKREPLGELVELKSVRALHYWTVARFTVKEERDVEVALRPYKNEILPKVTVESPDEVDPYSYDLFVGDRDEGKESLEVTGSARVVSCDKCNRGKVSCRKCHATGKVTCERCEGAGRLECPECVSGEVKGARGKKKCPRCRGLGDTDCPDCRDGKAKCSVCDGKGASQCPVCKGHGKVIQFIRVNAKRTRIADVQEVSAPSLIPIINQIKVAAISGKVATDDAFPLYQLESWISNEFDDSFEESRASIEMKGIIRDARQKIRVEKKRLDNTGLSSVCNIQSLVDRYALALMQNLRLEIKLPGYELFRVSGDGLPLPPLRGDVEISSIDLLGIRSDEDGRLEDDARFASVIFSKSLRGPVTSAPSFPGKLSANLATIFERIVRAKPSCSSNDRVVRDHVEIFVRSWVAADYSHNERNYVAFVGKQGIYSPGASPVSDEATVLVEEARAQISSKPPDVNILIDLIQSALSHDHIWPHTEALASLLTSLPKAKLSSGNKFKILDVIKARLDAMDVKRYEFLEIFASPEKDEYDDEDDCNEKREVEKTLLIEWILKIDTGRVTRDLIDALRAQIKSAASFNTGLIIAVLVGVAVLGYFLIFAPDATKESQPVVSQAVQQQEPSNIPVVKPVPAEPQLETDCGNASVNAPRNVSGDKWTDYRCMDRPEAGKRWGRCLNRKEYTNIAGRGCSGDDKCCPSN